MAFKEFPPVDERFLAVFFNQKADVLQKLIEEHGLSVLEAVARQLDQFSKNLGCDNPGYTEWLSHQTGQKPDETYQDIG